MTEIRATTSRPGRPPVVDQETWQAVRDELLVREKAHTREGDAIAAARRRLPKGVHRWFDRITKTLD